MRLHNSWYGFFFCLKMHDYVDKILEGILAKKTKLIGKREHQAEV